MVNNELMLINEESIKDKIYVIRGIPVMLDRDLALIYGYSVKRLNEQVQRNIEKFPSDMMFQLSGEEMPVSLKSQFATLNISNNKRGLHIKKYPYAFTEQGIYMLMTVLKGELATKQSIELVRLFKKMKDYIVSNKGLLTSEEANKLLIRHDMDKYFKSLFKEVNKSIIIIDNYISTKTLDLLTYLDRSIDISIYKINI